MLLVNISKFNGLTHCKRTAICLLQAHDKAEERCLSCTVRTDNTYDAVRRQHEVEVVEEYLLTESLLHVLCFDNLITKTWTVRNKDFEFLLTLLLLLVEHLLVRVQTSLTLSLTSLRSHTHPLQLTLQSLTTFRSRLLFLLHALCLLIEP